LINYNLQARRRHVEHTLEKLLVGEHYAQLAVPDSFFLLAGQPKDVGTPSHRNAPESRTQPPLEHKNANHKSWCRGAVKHARIRLQESGGAHAGDLVEHIV
jgi:hypothetical protein